MVLITVNFSKHSPLLLHVLSRLPGAAYTVDEEDIAWVDEVAKFLPKPDELTNAAVTAAANAAFEQYKCTRHIDPYELFIDANVCDSKCVACPEDTPVPANSVAGRLARGEDPMDTIRRQARREKKRQEQTPESP